MDNGEHALRASNKTNIAVVAPGVSPGIPQQSAGETPTATEVFLAPLTPTLMAAEVQGPRPAPARLTLIRNASLGFPLIFADSR